MGREEWEEGGRGGEEGEEGRGEYIHQQAKHQYDLNAHQVQCIQRMVLHKYK